MIEHILCGPCTFSVTERQKIAELCYPAYVHGHCYIAPLSCVVLLSCHGFSWCLGFSSRFLRRLAPHCCCVENDYVLCEIALTDECAEVQ